MNLSVHLAQTELATLTQLATLDRRSPDSVAEILLRHALLDCRTIECLRLRVDSLPDDQGGLPSESRQNLGVIDTIMEILKEAKFKNHLLTVDEIHKEVVRRCGSGSRLTVLAQLSRLPTERNFKIKKIQTGKHHAFAAE